MIFLSYFKTYHLFHYRVVSLLSSQMKSSELARERIIPHLCVAVHFQEIIDTGDGDKHYHVMPNTNVVVTRIAGIIDHATN